MQTTNTAKPSETGRTEKEMPQWILDEFDVIFEQMENDIERSNDDYWQQFTDYQALVSEM